jgi:hypothetical protein
MLLDYILLGISDRAGKVLGVEMDTNKLIQQAIDIGNTGNKQEARRILAQVVQQEPKNARAWYLLSQLVDKQDQVIYCLNKVLDIEPNNQKAAERLQRYKIETIPQAQQEQETITVTSSPSQQAVVIQKRKTKWWVYVLLIITAPILACMCFGMFSAFISDIVGDDPSSNMVNPFKLTHEVVYRVEGGAQSAMITYNNDQNGTEQVNEAILPWTKTYEMDNGQFATLVAQSGSYGNTITCIIIVDGKEWKRSTSSGDFVVVTCAGWLGME